jgi:HEAT repeat protein
MKTASKIGLTLVLALVLTVFISSAVLSQNVTEKENKEYNEYLIKALKDDNIGIRSSAAQLLGERKVKEAVKPLATTLKTEKNYAVRIVVALALHQIGDEKVLPLLKERLKKDRNLTVRHVLAGLIENLETTQYANNK